MTRLFNSTPQQANQGVQNELQITERWVELGLVLKSAGHWHSWTGVEELCHTMSVHSDNYKTTKINIKSGPCELCT